MGLGKAQLEGLEDTAGALLGATPAVRPGRGFPSRAAFSAVVNDPERQEAHAAHREVAMSDTYTMILRPLIDRLGASVAAGWS